MAFFDDFTRGLGLIGSAVRGNTAPLQGAVANTFGVDQGVWDQAMRAAGRPMYQNLGYASPLGPMETPVRALGDSVNRVTQTLR